MNPPENVREGDRLSEPTMTVVVPCRNERDHIEACIRSIVGQIDVAGGFEVIVVDGMSDDGTRDILDLLTAEYPSLSVIDNPQQITPVAMNVGVRRARGEQIAILGAHTVYAPDYLATCQRLLVEHPEVVGVGGPIRSRGQTVFGRAVARAMSHPLGIGNARHRYPDYDGYAEAVCFPVFRSEVFARHGEFDELLVRNQDDDFFQRIVRAGERLYLSPHAGCEYYVRGTPRELLEQYFRYGMWRVQVLRKHKRPFSFRQVLPFAFYSLMLLLLVCGPFLPTHLDWLAWIIPAVYAGAIVLGSVQVAAQEGIAVGAGFSLAVILLHLGYAAGFATGLVKSPRA